MEAIVIPISAIEHFVYCPRQCALVHCDGIWADNAHTVRGSRSHRRVDSGKARRSVASSSCAPYPCGRRSWVLPAGRMRSSWMGMSFARSNTSPAFRMARRRTCRFVHRRCVLKKCSRSRYPKGLCGTAVPGAVSVYPLLPIYETVCGTPSPPSVLNWNQEDSRKLPMTSGARNASSGLTACPS